ncbi:MAG: heat-inducible transcriptional repressor HrcA [Deltaproteobacteria bacterium]|nr:MAG: heat-inducible transcriptional repressor HrcA [Deltaproteobacteria bacterium]
MEKEKVEQIKLSERDKKILELIINDYINRAEPVGSRTISKRMNFALSPATIRNIMADLEELGFLVQPYTSAGRIPTDKGFRFYVDSILNVRRLTRKEREQIRKQFKIDTHEVRDIMRQASKILSSLSQCAGIVVTPKIDNIIIRHVEFIKINKKSVLVILVSKSGMVQNKIIEIESEIDQNLLTRMSNYLNSLTSDLTLSEVREKLIKEITQVKKEYDTLINQALILGQKVFASQIECDIFIDGQINIFDEPEFADVEKIKALFKAFEEKSQLIKLLDKSMEAPGIKIFIGSENQVPAIKDCAIISSTYGNRLVGTLGVIGPRRMDYSRVIPIVDYTAQLVTKLLDSK